MVFPPLSKQFTIDSISSTAPNYGFSGSKSMLLSIKNIVHLMYYVICEDMTCSYILEKTYIMNTGL